MLRQRVFDLDQIKSIYDPRELAEIGLAVSQRLEQVLTENLPQTRIEKPKPDRAEP